MPRRLSPRRRLWCSRLGLPGFGLRACNWAAATGLPWLFVVTHDALAAGTDADAILDGCGLTPILPLTGMRAAHVAAPAGVATDLDLSIAQDRPACEAVFDINAAAYDASLDACKPVFGEPSFWTEHVLALGRTGDGFVASTAVLMVDGVRYVAMVATLPDFQRRGYAEAVMRHALAHASARFGNKPSFLHATGAGRPLYARMGYEPIASHTAYIEKRFLDGH